MPVYDVAAGQVLAKPVSSFMQGRAMQIALQSEKLKNSAMEQEIGAFDDREARAERALRADEERVGIQGRQEERLQKQQQSEEEMARAEAARAVVEDPITRKLILDGLDEYEAAPDDDSKTKIASRLEEQIKRYYPNAPGFDDNGDGVLSPQEIQERRSALKAMEKPNQEATAGMQNAERILEVMRNETLSDAEKASMVKSLGGHIDSKGGITLDYEVAEEIAAEIMDSEDIGESGIFQSNDPVAQKLLAAEFMRLLKEGGMDISEVKKAAVESVTKLLQKEETPQAPKAALEMLYSDYDNLIDDFEAKYGYRPEPQ